MQVSSLYSIQTPVEKAFARMQDWLYRVDLLHTNSWAEIEAETGLCIVLPLTCLASQGTWSVSCIAAHKNHSSTHGTLQQYIAHYNMQLLFLHSTLTINILHTHPCWWDFCFIPVMWACDLFHPLCLETLRKMSGITCLSMHELWDTLYLHLCSILSLRVCNILCCTTLRQH